MINRHCLAASAVLALSLAGPATGAEEEPMITGKKNLVCASQNIVVCGEGANCLQGTASDFELPTFMFVDFKSKSIRAVGEDSAVTSPVKTYEVTDQTLIMQGYENHRGWTAAVNRMTGGFTVSATGPDMNFTIMGVCTTL
jgi:hypothetical protein